MFIDYSDEFFSSFLILLDEEGGFVNDKNDPGGMTKYGISKKSYPWIDIENLTKDQAAEIYFKDWWDKDIIKTFKCKLLKSKFFRISVNIGEKAAIKCIQKAIRCVSNNEHKLVVDGIYGNNTKKSLLDLKTQDHVSLYYSFKSEVASYYVSLGKSRYINGWLNRAYSK